MGVDIRDILVPYKKTVGWEALAGIAAVDAHNALYQFLSIIRQPDGTPLMDSRGRVTSHLSGILFRVLNFLELGIRPVFVFDGVPPEFKGATIAERKEIRREASVKWEEARARGEVAEARKHAQASSRVDESVISSSQELLGLLGIPWVQAPSEGEAQAAHMVAKGSATYAVSQDYDLLLFGAPVLVRNLTVSGKRKVRGRTITVNPEKLLLKEVLEGLNLTREQLIEIGILVGTDFNTGVRGIGPKKAIQVVNDGKFEETLEEKLPDFDPKPVKEFFIKPPVTDDFSVAWKPVNADGVVKMLCENYDFSRERVNSALDKVRVTAGQKTLDRWF
ncbi:MAG TPA: flap endonuclease-1 [Methanomicrobiales archaeon]|nr:flap endonuclease-1 [Methanomicrobiales archaeon]